ncbi:tRNA (adenosine(37)-N6)-threonylcarbamoyltransferase complex dimerization subunit type 1 TsaB [Marinithermofilum abyssi]|uniref:tRNA (Adenosine(37)-N6)-threonylcarbamoyltransferase complex dimerization subunit type 1 TsaB n=1 Tax=Marinithermofilum abyssi TaxID=1571185 RepID=A0A8J2YEI1_9BACL|nr:tRNA (adenosine(37)-N6)-threonylcarbamoyltransferase complex dimerization subunit type 1 TsaB [Marinithermofilum abyssi]GGE24109.1 tRNA (adenosine(37)-N6)-threonylcarbamoyltransferase complex dimerization subunit type 1 TsaB [Marinithermofilum abyssi]
MITLAIDTSTLVLGVAVLDEERVLGEVTTNLKKNHSVRLMPTVVSLLQELDLSPADIGQVAVAAGPGSYTGVRIGFTTAKTLTWSRNIPMLSVSSLAVLAMNGIRFPGKVVPMFDARRNRAYTGCFRAKNGRMEAVIPERVGSVDRWLKELRGEGPLLFLGDDVARFRDSIVQTLGNQAHFGLPGENIPRASHLAWLAYRMYKEDPRSVIQAAPNYLQMTEAEAKWLKANGVNKDGSSAH